MFNGFRLAASAIIIASEVSTMIILFTPTATTGRDVEEYIKESLIEKTPDYCSSCYYMYQIQTN